MLRVVESSRDKREKDSDLLVGSFRNFKKLGEDLDGLGTVSVLQGVQPTQWGSQKTDKPFGLELQRFPSKS